MNIDIMFYSYHWQEYLRVLKSVKIVPSREYDTLLVVVTLPVELILTYKSF